MLYFQKSPICSYIYVSQPVSSSPEAILQACVLVTEMTYFKNRLTLYSTKLLEKLLLGQEAKKVSAWYGIRRIFTILSARNWPFPRSEWLQSGTSYIAYWKLFNIIFEFTACYSELFNSFLVSYQKFASISIHCRSCSKLCLSLFP
jgi:hypothetical protein